MRNLAFVICMGILLGGCAVGNTHRYDLGDAQFQVKSKKSIAVAVVDVRPYVLDGDKAPNFSGLMRDGFGNPFDVTTDSGQPLAADFTAFIVAALQRDGIAAVAVPIAADTGETDARHALLASGADRCALLTIREWKSDTYVNTGLSYDMTLEVLAIDGAVIASEVLQGHDDLGTSGLPADARLDVEKAVKSKHEAMFGSSDIRVALE